jgi:hypothetical protein
MALAVAVEQHRARLEPTDLLGLARNVLPDPQAAEITSIRGAEKILDF